MAKKQNKQVGPKSDQSRYRKKPAKVGLLGTITIAGETISVVRETPCLAPDGDHVEGFYHPSENRIHLEARLSARAEREVFFHEIWHAIRDKYQIHMTPEQDEALAGPVGSGFGQALVRWFPKSGLRSWE